LKTFIFLIIKFFKKPLAEQLLYIEVTFWLGMFRIAILILPFKVIASLLGKHMSESDKKHRFKSMETAKLIALSIRTMSLRLPWECKCLAQAVSGKIMLDNRKISNTLYLGVAKDENEKLIAHAWLRIGENIILGDEGLDRFAVVSTFT
jgi:hypothetical protein